MIYFKFFVIISMLTVIIFTTSIYSQDKIWPYQSTKNIPYIAAQINNIVVSENKKPYPISSNIFLNPIVLYQKNLSRSSCQYFPSCSRYTYRSIEKYGPAKGLIMSADRLIRCSHKADQAKYYQIGPYFYDYPFEIFNLNIFVPYENSYENNLSSIISDKLDYAYYPSEPIFMAKNSNNSSSKDSLLFLFPENLMQNSDLKFAIHLYQEKEYFQASTELKRYIFINESYKDKIIFLIACCNYYAKRYLDAIYYFDQVKLNTNETDFLYFCEFLKAISFYNNRNVQQSEKKFINLLEKDVNPTLKENIIISLISLYLKTNNILKVKELINNTNFKFSSDKINQAIINLHIQKSSKLSLILSIVPGLGHIYSGSYKEGLYSFATNAALGYLFYDSYKNGSNSGKILSGAIFLQFYTGNLLGGKRAAQITNSIEMEKLNSLVQSQLKLSPEFKIIIKNNNVYLKIK